MGIGARHKDMELANQYDNDIAAFLMDTLNRLVKGKLSPERVLSWDGQKGFDPGLIEELLSPQVGLHLALFDQEWGGVGGSARLAAQLCERLASIDLALATTLFAIGLGADPIRVGGTPEQKEYWLSQIVQKGQITALAVTEPCAGSNVAQVTTKATPVTREGGVSGYLINGSKQFITNGGLATVYTVLAQAPGGLSLFVVGGDSQGLTHGAAEEKHGIRASNTTPLSFDDVFVPESHLLGEREGDGLLQINKVFGHTRPMVAAFGIGLAQSAWQTARDYARQRCLGGKSTLAEKQGVTHKLLLPGRLAIDSARSYLSQLVDRLDAGEDGLEVEGAIAKLHCSRVANAVVDDALQVLGGYGYMRECGLEKLRRDARILTIYEGTSEVMQSLISTYRMRLQVRGKGAFYQQMAQVVEQDAEQLAATIDLSWAAQGLARCLRMVGDSLMYAHHTRLAKNQALLFLLADAITAAETCAAHLTYGARTPLWVDDHGALGEGCNQADGAGNGGGVCSGGAAMSVDLFEASVRCAVREAAMVCEHLARSLLWGVEPQSTPAEIGPQVPQSLVEVANGSLAHYRKGWLDDMNLMAKLCIQAGH